VYIVYTTLLILVLGDSNTAEFMGLNNCLKHSW